MQYLYQFYKLPRNLLLVAVILFTAQAKANVTCKGNFVNPITDICWSCLMPISIGNLGIGENRINPKQRDIKNPESAFCSCTKGTPPVLIPGLAIGFWEPVRLVDVTRTPYCMTNLGGFQLGKTDVTRISSYGRGYNKRSNHNSFYHLHYYVYPLIYWLELLTDFACLEASTFDVAYMSEFDISWNDPQMQSFLNPDAKLFSHPIAQAACALDCASSTFATALDGMHWCAGCQGNMYPLSGANADHVGGVQNSALLTTRILSKLHRLGFAEVTSTTDASINGSICRKHKSITIKKSQYKLQMVNPKSSADSIGCWPLGLSDLAYSTFKEYPYDGQDWGYLIWRKRNCCLF